MLLPKLPSLINIALLSSDNFKFISQDPELKHTQVANYRPVVLWHGLGDNYNSTGLHEVKNTFEEYYPGISVYSISLHENPSNDQQLSIFGDANIVIDDTCNKLKEISELTTGFDAIGFSQGGLLLRALVEKCEIKVSNLITFGSPHMGVSELPLCKLDDWICKRRNAFMKKRVWFDSVQKNVIPAQYFRDPKDLKLYLKNSNFLADINNERDSINKKYSNSLSSLETLVLIDFLQDSTLVPKKSAHFYDQTSEGDTIEFAETRIYHQDRLGLKALHELNKIDFYTIDADHMEIPSLFIGEIADKYIGTIL